jgi:hypothetical protein
MNEPVHIDHDELLVEITRYLATVDLYRAENCEPTWRAELTPAAPTPESAHALARHARSTH